MSDLKPCQHNRFNGDTHKCAECGVLLVDATQPAQPAITSETGNQAAQGASAITSAVPLLSEDELAALMPPPDIDGSKARSPNAVRLAMRATEQAVRSKLGAGVGWQPIETAPKDGTSVLLCLGDRVTAGHWEPERYPIATEYHSTTGEYLGQFETGQVIDAWWYSEDGGFAVEDPPTHWMPLPPPPGIVGKEGGNV